MFLLAGASLVPATGRAQQAPAVTLPTLSVEGSTTSDGSAAAGYKVEQADLGPLGHLPLQDTPYSIDVVTTDLLQNQQVTSVTNALKYLPSETMADFGGQYGIGRPQSRGFQSSVIQNTRIDGMNAANEALPMEEFDRLEVLNGLSGTYYGGSNPAGTFNFVQRRPTAAPFLQGTASYYSNGLGEAFVDGSDSVLDGALGYRFTGLYQNGEGAVSRSEFRRDLESMALDWHVMDDLTIEGNLSHSNWNQRGYPAVFDYAQNAKGQATVVIPGPIDPTKVGYGQNFDISQNGALTGTLRLKYNFNADWSLTAGGLYQNAYGWPLAIANTFTNNTGTYSSTIAPAGNLGKTTDSNLIYLNGRVDAYGLTNDLVLGTNGFVTNFFSPLFKTSTKLGSATLSAPVIDPPPKVTYNKASYNSTEPVDQSLIFGDTITFDPQWQLMVTASQDWIVSTTYGTTGAVTAYYADSGLSPAVSIIFKPIQNVTTYFTYANSLQQGDTAPISAANANQNLAPYRSEQFEAGVKAKVDDLDVKADIFRINRPYANTNPATNVYGVIGNQVNDGFEFMTSGRVFDNFTLFGGVTLIDPRLTDTGIATTQGRQIVGVPRVQVNELIEYDVPKYPGLTFSVNVHYTGRRAADDANTQSIAGFTTVDVGGRYAMPVYGGQMTFNLEVDNVTNARYWASLLPADITGSASGTYQLSPGAPLQLLAAVTFKY